MVQNPAYRFAAVYPFRSLGRGFFVRFDELTMTWPVILSFVEGCVRGPLRAMVRRAHHDSALIYSYSPRVIASGSVAISTKNRNVFCGKRKASARSIAAEGCYFYLDAKVTKTSSQQRGFFTALGLRCK